MERVEEFNRDGKNFIYIDFSGLSSNDRFVEMIAFIKPIIAKYPERSLYTITNIENTRFDSATKEIAAEYMAHNAPCVKYGAVFGLNGIKKMMLNAIFKLSGRKNMLFAFTKERAIEMLLQHGS